MPDPNRGQVFKFNATGSEQLGELTFTPTPGQEAEGLQAIGFPLWVAVDPANGDVYASSFSAFVVTKFSPTGVFVSQITEGALPEEKGGHPVIRAGFVPGGIAVAPSGGELYVADRNNHVVDRFSAAGEYEMQFPDETVEGGFASSITTGPAGEVYVTEHGGAVRELSPSGVPVIKAPCATNVVDSNTAQFIALDPSNGALFVEEESGAFDIARYSPPCSAATTTFGEGLFPEGFRGIAISTSHVVYATNREGGDVEVFDPVGPPSAVTGAAKSITPRSAVICGVVNPISEALSASYQFQYGLKESYGQLAPEPPLSLGRVKKQKRSVRPWKTSNLGTPITSRSSRATAKGPRRAAMRTSRRRDRGKPQTRGHLSLPGPREQQRRILAWRRCALRDAPRETSGPRRVHSAGSTPRSAATRNTRRWKRRHRIPLRVWAEQQLRVAYSRH